MFLCAPTLVNSYIYQCQSTKISQCSRVTSLKRNLIWTSFLFLVKNLSSRTSIHATCCLLNLSDKNDANYCQPKESKLSPFESVWGQGLKQMGTKPRRWLCIKERKHGKHASLKVSLLLLHVSLQALPSREWGIVRKIYYVGQLR